MDIFKKIFQFQPLKNEYADMIKDAILLYYKYPHPSWVKNDFIIEDKSDYYITNMLNIDMFDQYMRGVDVGLIEFITRYCFVSEPVEHNEYYDAGKKYRTINPYYLRENIKTLQKMDNVDIECGIKYYYLYDKKTSDPAVISDRVKKYRVRSSMIGEYLNGINHDLINSIITFARL